MKWGIKATLIVPGYTLRAILLFVTAYFKALFSRTDSLVVVQRVQSKFLYASLLKFLVRCTRAKCIYDLDDADYFLTDPDTIFYFAKWCDQVNAGSESIRNTLKEFNPNTIFISSPTPDLGIVSNQRNKQLTIGWIGDFGGGHARGLFEMVFPALKSIWFDAKLILMGVKTEEDRQTLVEYFQSYPNIDLDIPIKIDWLDEEKIQLRIADFDIGVATLLNEPIQIAKSGIKVKQYLNNGIPVLCNRLYENSRYLRHEKNGLFCDSKEEFQLAFNRFREMKNEEYLRFSRCARESIEDFNQDKYLIQLLGK